jgi:hypothetical protein
MSMVVSAPVRIIVSGIRMTAEMIEDRIKFSVRLIQAGLRPR